MKRSIWLVRLVATVILVVALKPVWLWMLKFASLEQLTQSIIRSASLTLLTAIMLDIILSAIYYRASNNSDTAGLIESNQKNSGDLTLKGLVIFITLSLLLGFTLLGIVLLLYPQEIKFDGFQSDIIVGVITITGYLIALVMTNTLQKVLNGLLKNLSDAL